jgi:hypothetical protein
MYNPDVALKIYDQKIWYSDSWDEMEYGREFDYSKTFAENFKALMNDVPRPSMYNYFAENSDYCNCTNYQKDSYLVSASSRNDTCMYGAYTMDSKHCMDTFMTFTCENSYMTIDCEDSYRLIYASNCKNCSQSYFLTNCTNCSNCIDCSGMNDASYCYQNNQLTKEEYEKVVSSLVLEDLVDARYARKQDNTILYSE